MDMAEQICPHVAVQEHERVGRCLQDGKAHIVFRWQVREMVLVGHRVLAVRMISLQC